MFKTKLKQKQKDLLLISFTTLLGITLLIYGYLLPDQLVHSWQVLSLSDYEYASSAFLTLTLLAFATLLAMSATFLYLYKTDHSQIIQVEQKKMEDMDDKSLSSSKKTTFLSKTAAEILGGRTDEPFQKVFSYLCEEVQAVHGVVFVKKKDTFRFETGYALSSPDIKNRSFSAGEGLAGQAAEENSMRLIKNLEEHFPDISSGLGKSKPDALLLIPLSDVMGTVQGVVELAVLGNSIENKLDKVSVFCSDWGQLIEFEMEEEEIQIETTKKKSKKDK